MNTSNLRVAFIGLGVMGFPMAGHLHKHGYHTAVYNRTSAKASNWLQQHPASTQQQSRVCHTPAEAAEWADVIFTCVGNDDDLRSVTLGHDGVLSSIKAGALLVDHTTASADIARQLAQACHQKQAGFIDAPVSGGQQGAENGQLTIMCGGDPAAFERAREVMQAYAKAITHMGAVGAGQLTKMVNQICVAGVLQGLAEGLHFAEQAGLDLQKVVDAISQGAAGSWQMTHRHKTMIAGEYDHGFAVDWMKKDLDICLAEARQRQLDLPVTHLIKRYYEEIQAQGGGRWDTSSLFKRLQSTPTR